MKRILFTVLVGLFCLAFLPACPSAHNSALITDVAPANNNNGPSGDGLVTIEISASKSLKYGMTDIGFQKTRAGSDGKVRISLPYGRHMVNACDKKENYSIDNNGPKFPIYVNGVKMNLYRTDPRTGGRMWDFYVDPDGKVWLDEAHLPTRG